MRIITGTVWVLFAGCRGETPPASEPNPPAETVDTNTEPPPTDTGTDSGTSPPTELPCTPGLAASEPPYAWTWTTSGCWAVGVGVGIVQVRVPELPGTVELWGGNYDTGVVTVHENLFGKHIKDSFGSRRTLLLPDGSTITTVTDVDLVGVGLISLYDAANAVEIDVASGQVTWEAADAAEAAEHEAARADGETAEIRLPGDGVVVFVNVYQQDEDGFGAPQEKVYEELILGETGGDVNPSQVLDYYDDPRLNHT